MKYIILILISLPVFANRVPLSEAQRYIAACPGGVPALYTCADKPNEECLDFTNIEWCTAEIKEIRTQVDDITKPKYGPEKEVEACTAETCQALLAAKVCKDKESAYISKEFDRVYCIELKGYEKKEVVTIELRENEAKKAAKDKKDKDEKDAKIADKVKKESAKEALKALDLTKTKTTKELTDIIKLILDSRQE